MSDLRYAVGVDVGGTKIAAYVVDSNGTILRKVKLATDRQERDRPVAKWPSPLEKRLPAGA